MAHPDKILIMDDDLKMRELLFECLAPLEYDATSVNSGHQALKLLKTGNFSVAILDLMLPDFSGMEVLRRIRNQRPELEVIVITGHASLETAIEALRMGAYDYITKPFNARTVQSTVRRAVEKHHFRVRLTALNRATQAMIATLDPDAVLTLAMAEARTMLNAEATAILLLDKSSGELCVAATANAISGVLTGACTPDNAGIAGWVGVSFLLR